MDLVNVWCVMGFDECFVCVWDGLMMMWGVIYVKDLVWCGVIYVVVVG